MDERQIGQDTGPQAVVEAYLEAFRERDLSRCLDFYADDAEIHFMDGVFKGKQAIEEWHRDRFAAELELVKVGKLRTEGGRVTSDVTVTSTRLRAWKIDKLAGKATVLVEQGKIKETRLSPRAYNPLEGW